VWDVESGRLLKTFDDRLVSLTDVAFSPDGSSIAVAGHPNFVFDVSAGKPTLSLDASCQPAESVAYAPDSSLIAFGLESGDICLINARDGTLQRRLHDGGWVQSLSFTDNGARLISAGSDGQTKLWHLASGAEIVSLLAAADGEWAMITPEGFFAASANGADLLQVTRGTQVFTVDQFFQALYRPDLVRQKLGGDVNADVKAAAARLDLAAVLASGTPPRVSLSAARKSEGLDPAVSARALIEDAGGGIGRIEWRLNGLTIGSSLADPAAGARIALDRDIALGEGRNLIEIVAYNRRNLISSPPMQIAVDVPEGGGAEQHVFVLAAGVDAYAGEWPALRYSRSDAAAFAESIRRSAKASGIGVESVILEDAEFNLDGLRAGLERLSATMRPSDIFVFFLAGHGKTIDARFYFIPATLDSSDDADVMRAAVGQDAIQSLLSAVPALRSLMVFDACESGSLAELSLATRGAERSAAAERLSRSVGRTLISATTDNAVALEGHAGHGLLTFTFISALREAAVGKSGRIPVSELVAFSCRT
jgi:Caspase domain/WD domain, G-beta repeat